MFLNEAQSFGNNLPCRSCGRAFFDIVTENAVGQQNAISKEEISALLSERGFNRCEASISSDYIAPSRRMPHFFGIKRYKGIYIIDNSADARLTLEYYAEQVRGSQRHANYLRQLCREYRLRI
jgi:hypothetical protein